MVRPPSNRFQTFTLPDEEGMMSPSAVYACPRCGTSEWTFCLFRELDDPKPRVVKRCAWDLCRSRRGAWMHSQEAEALKWQSGVYD